MKKENKLTNYILQELKFQKNYKFVEKITNRSFLTILIVLVLRKNYTDIAYVTATDITDDNYYYISLLILLHENYCTRI